MLTDCPACATSYDLKEARIPPGGRKIVCSVCETRWVASPLSTSSVAVMAVTLPTMAQTVAWPTLTTAAVPMIDPPNANRNEQATRTARRRMLRVPPKIWATGLAALVMLTCVAQRERMVRIAPPVARVYALIGLPVNLRGLTVQALTPRLLREGDKRVLTIEGQIANVTRDAKPIPDLRLAVRAPGGQEIYVWTMPAPQPKLEQGGQVAFRTRLNAPPVDGLDVSIGFTDAKGTKQRVAAR